MKNHVLLGLAGLAIGGAAALFANRPDARADDLPDGDLYPGPVELGAVDWGRDYDAAAELAAERGRPMFLLFQEVPG